VRHADIEFLGDPRRSRSLMRQIRTGAALFASGIVVGIVLAVVFGALIKIAVVTAAFLIVAYALLRLAFRRQRY
jgi:hypothetical protein